MSITDTALRGIILKKYYDKRKEGSFQWKDEDFADLTADFDGDDLFRICDQLANHGLIDWRGVPNHQGKTIGGLGKINANGVDVIEGNVEPPIAITVDQSNTFSVHAPSNFQVGSHNTQLAGNNVSLDVSLGQIGDSISNSPASAAQKEEAKSVIARAFEHPAVKSVLGTAVESAVNAILK